MNRSSNRELLLRGKLFYSLGNFRADQGFSEETKIGEEALFTAEHTYDGIRITGFETKEINTYWKDDMK